MHAVPARETPSQRRSDGCGYRTSIAEGAAGHPKGPLQVPTAGRLASRSPVAADPRARGTDPAGRAAQGPAWRRSGPIECRPPSRPAARTSPAPAVTGHEHEVEPGEDPWLRDDSLEDADNLPAPEIIAREIVEDLTAALAEFEAVAAALEAGSNADPG